MRFLKIFEQKIGATQQAIEEAMAELKWIDVGAEAQALQSCRAQLEELHSTFHMHLELHSTTWAETWRWSRLD